MLGGVNFCLSNPEERKKDIKLTKLVYFLKFIDIRIKGFQISVFQLYLQSI